MSDENNRFRFLFYISIVLAGALLISGGLFLHQVDALLGNNAEVEVEVAHELPPEEQEIIDEPAPTNDYTLRRNPTEYQIELFELLVNAHDQFYETGLDTDLKKYASAIVQNFIADFFTLSNKTARQDVGGLQFFSEEVADSFRSFAIDEFYLYLNQHIATYGSDSLPTVESTTIQNVEFGTRMIELEKKDEVDVNEATTFDYDGGVLEEEVRTIIIDAEWSYVNSPLWYIDEFQIAARFTLIPSEEGVRIYVIELPEIENEAMANS